MHATELSGPPSDEALAALALHPERIAFQDAHGELTYAQARDQVYRMAGALLSHGLRPGQVVASVLPISTQAILLTHAINHAGCGWMGVPVHLPVDVQTDLINEAGAAAVVIDPAARGDDLIRLQTATSPAQLFSMGPGRIGEDLLALADRESPLPFESAARPDAMSTLGLTGATTGRPKIVMRRFDSVPSHRPGHSRLPRAQRPVRLLKCETLSLLLRQLVEDTIASGGTVLTRVDSDPVNMIATIETQRITHLFVPPYQLRALIDHPLLASTDTSSLRWVLCTTAKAPVSLLRRAVKRLGPVVYQSYGQTEAQGISRLSPEDYFPGRLELLATCGRAFPGVEIAVRSTTGHALGNGERGELWVRTPYVMAGYLNRPDLTAQVLRDGWLRTGDIGFLDENGFVTLLGRATDAVDIEGQHVLFADIENCLDDHPGVADCAAFTVPGPTPTLHVAVVREESICTDEDGLCEALLRQLGPAHVPQSILFVPKIPLAHGYGSDRIALGQWWSDGHPPGRPGTGR